DGIRVATVTGVQTCALPIFVGGGPIPVSVAQRMVEDSFVKAVLVDGTDVLAVSHHGRMIPARLRTAVEELHPECDREGCHVTLGDRKSVGEGEREESGGQRV